MTAPATGFDAPAAPGASPAGAAPAAPAPVAKRGWLAGQRQFWRQFIRHRDGLFGVIVLLFFTVMAIAPQLFVGPLETVTTASGTPFEAPSATHIFGTDELGRDILNLTVHGARVSMVIGLLATVITILLGAVIGIVSGFFGGRTDAVLMRLTDFFLVLPTFVLALVLAPIILDVVGETSQIAGIRMTLIVIIIVIGITSWASTARIIRSQALSVKERMFVDRARVIGSGGGHIMRRHILPNVLNLIVANTVLVFGGAILTETLLAFVGLGDPFAPSWGQILNSAETQGAPTLGAWWYIVPPATCVVLVVLAFTLVGGALDAILNPRLRTRR
jgi:peptide/nickel transport system permease protein